VPNPLLKSAGRRRRLVRRLSCPRRGGFTLVELLLVAGMALLLLGLSVPAVQALARGSHRHAAIGAVIARLEAARAEAIAGGRPVSLVLAAPERPGEGHRATALYRQPEDYALPPERVSAWEALPAGFVLEEDAALERLPAAEGEEPLSCVVFGPTGALETAGSPPCLIVKAPGGARESIAIARFTGRCRLEP